MAESDFCISDVLRPLRELQGLLKTLESCSERLPFAAGVREGHSGNVGEGPVRDQ